MSAHRSSRCSTATRFPPAGQIEGEHPATRRQQPPGDRVVRIVGQARVVDAGDSGVDGQPLSERKRVGALPFHPQRQGLHSAQDQPGRERVG